MGKNNVTNSKKGALGRILRYMKGQIPAVVLAVICAAGSVILSLYTTVLIGRAIDCIGDKTDFERMIPILITIAAIIPAVAILQWLMYFLTNLITHKTVKTLRTDIFKHLQDMPLAYIDANSHGDIISRVVNDVDAVSDGLLQGFQQLFTGVVTIIGTLVFMVSLNWQITLVVVCITPLSFAVAAVISKLCFNKFKEQSAIKGELTGYIDEHIGGQRLVKAFGFEDAAEKQFAEINERLNVCGRRAQFYSALTNPCTRFGNSLVYAGVGIFGALNAVKAVNGGFTVGDLSCFLQYANQYTKPFNEISGVVTELQNALASAARIFALIDEPTEISDADKKVLENADGRVDIENVDFSYIPEKPLIEDLNLNVKSGQHIAIVGPTGCGKTTLINLLMRFYDVVDGEIRVSGDPIKNITRSSLRGSFGIVLQETWVFKGTVRDNISYGKPDATLDEIIAAAKAAHAHSFIKRLPQGYDTVITNDAELSQGQRQLLSIARVMLALPPMLILDEATSSIDTRTEMKIQNAFDKMMLGRTSFVVAHRLSTIREADCILVMKSGHIVEQGTHAELLKNGGFYAELIRSRNN
ncbi:MAG: ABC transporter ATP-binding protein/permease [Oscillospiraceae bacterium]|nr:ABC transporter ATP-binding protein/permease [Oscillospiraceae bacterium]